MTPRRKRKNKGSSRIKPTNWKLTMANDFLKLSYYSMIKDLLLDHSLKLTNLFCTTLIWHLLNQTLSSLITLTK